MIVNGVGYNSMRPALIIFVAKNAKKYTLRGAYDETARRIL